MNLLQVDGKKDNAGCLKIDPASRQPEWYKHAERQEQLDDAEVIVVLGGA